MESDEVVVKGPASPGQRLLWAFERGRAVSGAVNIPTFARLRSALDRQALQSALDSLVIRHEALRTRMIWEPPKLTRVVASRWSPPITVLDFRDTPDPNAAFMLALRTELTTNIAATDWPLRPTIFTLAPDDHVICLNIHHNATDGISMDIVLTELCLVYRAARGEVIAPFEEIGWQYSQWVDWGTARRESDAEARHILYCEEQLKGAVGPRFPAVAHLEGSRRLTGFEAAPPTDLIDGMARLAARERATLFCVVLAVFYATICRHTRQTDLTVTSIMSDRIQREVQGTVGFFVRAVALRTRFDISDSFWQLLRICRQTVFDAIQFQTMPFLTLRPFAAATPLIDAVVQVMEFAQIPEPFERWMLPPDFGAGRSFNLELVVAKISNRWGVGVLYATNIFEAVFIRQFLADFHELGRAAIADPSLTLRELIGLESGAAVSASAVS